MPGFSIASEGATKTMFFVHVTVSPSSPLMWPLVELTCFLGGKEWRTCHKQHINSLSSCLSSHHSLRHLMQATFNPDLLRDTAAYEGRKTMSEYPCDQVTLAHQRQTGPFLCCKNKSSLCSWNGYGSNLAAKRANVQKVKSVL